MSRKIALLTNPRAGRGHARRLAALALPRLREAGFGVREIEGHDAAEALDLASQAVADGLEALVVCGGDGLVHVAVQALAGSPTALGVLPAGTGNDAARSLGVPRSDPLAAVDLVVASRVREIDLARCGATYVLTVLATGFDALVARRAEEMAGRWGAARYHLATLAALRRLAPLPYVLELDGVTRSLDATLVAVGNGPTYGGGLRISHGAVLDDGLLDVVVIGPMSRGKLMRTYPRLLDGSHVGLVEHARHRVREVTVATPGGVAYGDGERVGPLPLTVEVAPRALRVLAGEAWR